MHNCALRLCAGLGLHRDSVKLREGHDTPLLSPPRIQCLKPSGPYQTTPFSSYNPIE